MPYALCAMLSTQWLHALCQVGPDEPERPDRRTHASLCTLCELYRSGREIAYCQYERSDPANY